ncbi:MAG: UbiX family flavin prenyltransferase [Bacillota bacterium]
MRIIVGITGGSGAIYALALLSCLRELCIETHLVVSDMGMRVMEHECGVTLEELRACADVFHENDNLAASVASGSFQADGMVIVPCSMKTLSAVANGFSDTLLARAADVCMKERRRLVLVVRETPYNSVHLENMLRLSHAGAIMLPASPAFYNRPQTIGDIVKFMSGKILDQLQIEHEFYARWNGELT